MTMPSTGQNPRSPAQPMRVTDEDRARTATMLNDAFARGALGDEEHEQRVARAWAARDGAELATLAGDLPAASAADAERARLQSELREWLDEWRWWFGGAVVMSTIWGVQAIRTGPDFYWPLGPLGIWAAILVAVAIWPSDEDD